MAALRTLRNFYVMRHGGATNRMGTSFVAELKDSAKEARLIPFVFNSSQTYMLLFGDETMRVIQDGAQLSDLSLTITGITNASTGVVTYTGTDPSNGDEVAISGIVGAIGSYLNGRNFKVANVNTGANTFELQYLDGTSVNTTSMGSYGSAGVAERVYTLVSPFDHTHLRALNYVQSADVVTFAHPSYAPRELSRTGHTSWSFASITFAPSVAGPTGVDTDGAFGTLVQWTVTSIDSETREESLTASTDGANALPTSGSPQTITWNAVSGITEYNVYKTKNGVLGFIGYAQGTSFLDNGIDPDTNESPPTARNPFGSTDNYPSTVAYYQERLGFANTNTDPEKIWFSRSGHYKNFTISTPTQDDDAVTFSMAGRQVNQVRSMIDLGTLLVLSSGGEFEIQGDSSGVLRPGEVNRKQYSYNGSAALSPIVIDGTALYVQARGSTVRTLGFDYQVEGYNGSDLTIFSAHLFDGHEIVAWAYQQIPHSIVWAVRDDGVLLGLTYVREHQLWAWHRHDLAGGTVLDVSVIPEGTEDVVYLIVEREINGATKRYVEKMGSRAVSEETLVDAAFMDSSLSYDGRNTNNAHTMTLSGSAWTHTDTITITSSTGYFTSNDVGNEVQLTGADGTVIRVSIAAYSSTTVVTGKPHKTVPVAMRATAISNWSMAVDTVSGLWHLEGENVSVFADGFVVGSPNNDSYTQYTVTNGAITLNRPYAVIHVGIPITADIETLDIDTAQSETLSDKKKLVTKVSVSLEASRGLFAGASPPSDDSDDPLEGLNELKVGADRNYNDPPSLSTQVEEVTIKSEWNSNGRVFLRQVDPLPLTVLAIYPSGFLPFKG